MPTQEKLSRVAVAVTNKAISAYENINHLHREYLQEPDG